jgi:hypothetical protein
VRPGTVRRYVAARRRRRLGGGLLAFGIVGLVLIAGSGILVLGSLDAVDQAATGFERQRTELVAMLRPSAASLRDAAASAANAGTSLTTSGAAADRAAVLATNLADSFDGLATLGSFEIFGARPFAGLSTEFSEVGVDARALATDLGTVSASLRINATDAASVAANLNALATQLEALAASVGAPAAPVPGASPGPALDPAVTESRLGLQLTFARVLVMGLLAWLAVPAIASTWLGWRLLRARPG